MNDTAQLRAVEIGEGESVVLLYGTLDLIIEGDRGNCGTFLFAVDSESELSEELLGFLTGPCNCSGEVECLYGLTVLVSENVYGSTTLCEEVGGGVRTGVGLVALLDLGSYDSLKSLRLNVSYVDNLSVEGLFCELNLEVSYKKLALEVVEAHKHVDDLERLGEYNGNVVPLAIEYELSVLKLGIAIGCERMRCGSLDLNVGVNLEGVTLKVGEGVSLVLLNRAVCLVAELVGAYAFNGHTYRICGKADLRIGADRAG